jgi:Protein of unknown function (DUF1501)
LTGSELTQTPQPGTSGQIRCPGTLARRGFLRLGFSALGGLGLADLLRLQSAAAMRAATGSGERGLRQASKGSRTSNKNDKAIIVIWLWGGPSHMETFDLKPEAPTEYRGEFRPISTRSAGLQICEHLPRLAQLGDQIAILRSLGHDSPGHVSSTHTLLTGYPGEVAEMPPFRSRYPDFWSIVSKTRGERSSGVPVHVALPTLRYNGSAYLNGGLDPFVVSADPNESRFHVPNLALERLSTTRFADRLDLLKRFDGYRHSIDDRASDSMDEFNRKAASLLTRGELRRAFEVEREDHRTRERYGRHAVGQRCLLARRLIEAGVRMVTVDFPHVPGQKAFSWDDHASVWNIFTEMKLRLPVLDQVTSALIEDLRERGLDKEVLVVVMGEMSHTPRLSNFQGQPGREHWGHTMSVLLAGGGLRMGQAVGATNRRGDEAISRPLKPTDLLATLYDYFGISPETAFISSAGRPTRILPDGQPISELI